MADVYAGKIDPRVAAGLAALISLQLRTIETVDLARRLENVEKLLATPPSNLSGGPDVPGHDLGNSPSGSFGADIG